MSRERRGWSAERRRAGFLCALSCALHALLAPWTQAQSPCQGGEYHRALCAYRSGDFAGAEVLFRSIAGAQAQAPETIKSRYFLARSLMKQNRWEEAGAELIRIYGLSRAFYDEWNCDFLLGECRRALGRD